MMRRTWIICSLAAFSVLAGCQGGDRAGSRWGLGLDAGGERDAQMRRDVQLSDVQRPPDSDVNPPDVDANPPDDGSDDTRKPEVKFNRATGAYTERGIAKEAADGSYCAVLYFHRYEPELVELEAEFPFENGTAFVAPEQCPLSAAYPSFEEEVLEVESVDGEIRQLDESTSGLSVDVRIRLAETVEGVPETIHIERSELTLSRPD